MTCAWKNEIGEETVKNQSKRTMRCPILNRDLSEPARQRGFHLPYGKSHTAHLKSAISNLKFQFSTPSPAISYLIREISNAPRPQKHQGPPQNSGRAGTLSALTVLVQEKGYHKLVLFVNIFL
jgi:hypothetical protein